MLRDHLQKSVPKSEWTAICRKSLELHRMTPPPYSDPNFECGARLARSQWIRQSIFAPKTRPLAHTQIQLRGPSDHPGKHVYLPIAVIGRLGLKRQNMSPIATVQV